ncbi:hypothetical protein LMG23992_04476 [Cupriavidus laharis]|uniref:MFS transporter n=1 Tax=Cupriavidus laharis TaxID=151654 RepID=A0ABM8XM61_9BURK|nr:hypothetical protein LMG23992_04476 [Cupriavidus laharis]
MVQMLAIGLGVTVGGGLVTLFTARIGEAGPAFRLAVVVVSMITLLSALVFRRLDVGELGKGRRAASVSARTP